MSNRWSCRSAGWCTWRTNAPATTPRQEPCQRSKSSPATSKQTGLTRPRPRPRHCASGSQRCRPACTRLSSYATCKSAGATWLGPTASNAMATRLHASVSGRKEHSDASWSSSRAQRHRRLPQVPSNALRTTPSGSGPRARMRFQRPKANVHSPAFEHALIKALCVTTLDSRPILSMSPNSCNAAGQSAFFSQALMAALYEILSTSTVATVSSRKTRSAAPRRQPFSQALIAALKVTASNDNRARRASPSSHNATCHARAFSQAETAVL
mmetsp:Transcript_42173/g.116429  ORF Transcript_42173/g.116429 Transcript_42173/m.116429 type:complete len:269 (-) Transcript_42173:219-1025(-)